jgi:hypothetical protein
MLVLAGDLAGLAAGTGRLIEVKSKLCHAINEKVRCPFTPCLPDAQAASDALLQKFFVLLSGGRDSSLRSE